jgi:integrase
LSDRAVEILKSLPRDSVGSNEPSDYIFIGHRKGQGLSSMAMNTLLKRRMKFNGTATVHGFRATFKTWASELTNFQNDVIEMSLAHAVGTKVEQAYQRGTMFAKRTSLMNVWADYIEQSVTGEVIPFREAI